MCNCYKYIIYKIFATSVIICDNVKTKVVLELSFGSMSLSYHLSIICPMWVLPSHALFACLYPVLVVVSIYSRIKYI